MQLYSSAKMRIDLFAILKTFVQHMSFFRRYVSEHSLMRFCGREPEYTENLGGQHDHPAL